MGWWVNNSNLNMLKGVNDDDDNPIRLSDDNILYFLRTIPAARDAFNEAVPQMLPDEQERLRALAESAQFMAPDYKAVEDAFQSALNKAGVRTTGRYGGARRGGNN
jgi:hypothetical protein